MWTCFDKALHDRASVGLGADLAEWWAIGNEQGAGIVTAADFALNLARFVTLFTHPKAIVCSRGVLHIEASMLRGVEFPSRLAGVPHAGSLLQQLYGQRRPSHDDRKRLVCELLAKIGYAAHRIRNEWNTVDVGWGPADVVVLDDEDAPALVVEVDRCLSVRGVVRRVLADEKCDQAERYVDRLGCGCAYVSDGNYYEALDGAGFFHLTNFKTPDAIGLLHLVGVDVAGW